MTVGPKAMPNVVGRVLLGLLPLWILLYQVISFGGTFGTLGDNPPSVVGLPAGMLAVGAALVVMALGVMALRRARSTRALLFAFLLLTVPAAAVIVVGPALILIVQNMAV